MEESLERFETFGKDKIENFQENFIAGKF